jgi:hypothetical protein
MVAVQHRMLNQDQTSVFVRKVQEAYMGAICPEKYSLTDLTNVLM